MEEACEGSYNSERVTERCFDGLEGNGLEGTLGAFAIALARGIGRNVPSKVACELGGRNSPHV